MHHAAVETARAGDRCALAIVGPRLERARLKRGDWLVDPALDAPTQRVDVWLRATGDRAPKHAARVHVHIGAADLTARLLLAKGADLTPGEAGFASLALDRPGVALHGDRVILRDASTGRVVAGGRVVDPFAPAGRRRREQRDASLAAHALTDPAEAFRALMAAEGWVDLRPFILARNLPAQFCPDVEPGTIRSGAVYASPATVMRIEQALTRSLQAAHAAHPDQMGPGKAALVRAASPVPGPITEAVLDLLRERGTLVRDGLAWRLPSHRPSLAPLDEAAWPRVVALLDAGGLRPPRVRELAVEMGLEPDAMEALLIRLERFGRLARVAPNRFFPPETVEALIEIGRAMTEEAEEAGFTAATFNKRTGIGRNLTIEVLEYLDRIGVTKRTGDLRHIVRQDQPGVS